MVPGNADWSILSLNLEIILNYPLKICGKRNSEEITFILAAQAINARISEKKRYNRSSLAAGSFMKAMQRHFYHCTCRSRISYHHKIFLPPHALRELNTWDRKTRENGTWKYELREELRELFNEEENINTSKM